MRGTGNEAREYTIMLILIMGLWVDYSVNQQTVKKQRNSKAAI